MNASKTLNAAIAVATIVGAVGFVSAQTAKATAAGRTMGPVTSQRDGDVSNAAFVDRSPSGRVVSSGRLMGSTSEPQPTAGLN